MTTKKKYIIQHDRETCIGCSACASVCPNYWTMESDGKANLLGHTKDKNQNQNLGTKEKPLTKDFEDNLDAAESCPVNCIHITEIDENSNQKKII